MLNESLLERVTAGSLATAKSCADTLRLLNLQAASGRQQTVDFICFGLSQVPVQFATR